MDKIYDLGRLKEQTPEICMAAVQQNGLALFFVKEPTPEICIIAIAKNPEVKEFVKFKPEQM